MACSKYVKSLLHRQLCPLLKQSSSSSLRNNIVRFQSTSTVTSTQTSESVKETVQDHVFVNHAELFKRIDWDYITNKANKSSIEENAKRRKANVDLNKILSLYEQVLSTTTLQSQSESSSNILNELVTEALKLPNSTHSNSWRCAGEDNNVIRRTGNKLEDEVLEFKKFCKYKNLIRTDNLGSISCERAYFLFGAMAELEQALIRFAIDGLIKNGFEIISVPDILYSDVIESCGFPTKGLRNQVYHLDIPNEDHREVCLSGTAEMAIAGFLQNRTFNFEELPLKFAAVSRCYRAEISQLQEESGLYRVHSFTKVEMYGVTANETGNESNELQEHFLSIQEDLFKQCGLHFQTVEMAPCELGSSAYRKFDIEAWMPGRKTYGEISSCSNCTDYQSRRHNIRYKKDGKEKFAHTINATACAIPRMLISLVETFQTPKGSVELPEAIRKFMAQDWNSANNHPIETNFLRTKSQMDRVTTEYN